MTNPASSDVYLAEVPGRGISIGLHFSLIDRIEQEVLEAFRIEGREVGGILLGTVHAGPSILIEDYEPVASSYLHSGKLYESEDLDRSTLDRALTLWHPDPASQIYVVGFYRSNCRPKLTPDSDDISLVSGKLGGSDGVLLLVQPASNKPTAAALYFAEKGRIQSGSPRVELPFNSRKLLKRTEFRLAEEPVQPVMWSAGGGSYETGPGKAESKRRARGVWWSGGVVILSAALGLGIVEYRALDVFNSQARLGIQSSPLGLKAERAGSQWQLSWNPGTPAIANAMGGHLTIADGPRRKDIAVDAGELRSGRILYTPATDDFRFQLEVFAGERGRSVSESLRVLSDTVLSKPPAVENVAPVEPVQPAKSDVRRPSAPAERKPQQFPPARPPINASPTPARFVEKARPASIAPNTMVIPSAPPLTAGLADTRSAVPSWTPPSTPVPAAPAVHVTAPQPVVAQPIAPRPVVIGGEGQPAQVIQETPPIYPPIAKHAGISGTVRVEVNVGTDGRVTLARATSGPLALRLAAAEAVKSWIFKPASLNGRAVATTSFVEVNFRLSSKASGR